jgi:O-acetylhomoserine (thiol)-lyase
MSGWGFDTRAVHASSAVPASGRASSTPLYDSAAFAYDTAEELEDVFAGRKPGYVYSRIANPTVAELESRLAALEGGRGAVALASGMAAVTAAIVALARSGDSIVFSRSLFGGTLLFAGQVLARMGIDARFADMDNLDTVAEATDETTRGIFVESIGNPKLDVIDVADVCAFAESKGVPVVVDNTLATPLLQQPGSLGAAIVVHSTTKFVTGNGTAIGGAIVDTGRYDWRCHSDPDLASSVTEAGQLGFLVHARRRIVQNVGSAMAPITAWTQLQGLPTLGLRVRRHCDNALALARYLEGNPAVREVGYPGLVSSPWHHIAKRTLDGGFGGLLTIRLGSKDRAFRLLGALELTTQLANLGDVKTLAIHPGSTIYRNCTPGERADAGVTDDLVRVSVGIETPDDIIEDFSQALDCIAKE